MSSLHLTPGKRPLPKLGSLEVGRALAAMAVVAHHAGQASDAFTTQKFGNRFEVGALGVDFFFILSGFIIYHVHGRDARTWEAARKFVEKRLRRIYVPYLPVTIALIAAYTLFPELSHAGRDWSILTSLTLIPTGSPPALSVAWTLSFEIMFYCFFLILFCTRYFWICVLAWTAAVVTVAWVGLADRLAPPTLQAFLDPIVLEFIAGMGAALLFSHLRPSSWPIPMFIGICLTGIFFVAGNLHRTWLGLALAPLVLGIALAEVRFHYRLPRAAMLLGTASYSVYLIHNPLQSIVARVFRAANYWPLTFLASCLAAISVGICYHLLFEAPILRALSRSGGRANKIKMSEGALSK